jgi:hypothetical protein
MRASRAGVFEKADNGRSDRVVIAIGCSLSYPALESPACRVWMRELPEGWAEDVAKIIRKSPRKHYGFISGSRSFLQE